MDSIKQLLVKAIDYWIDVEGSSRSANKDGLQIKLDDYETVEAAPLGKDPGRDNGWRLHAAICDSQHEFTWREHLAKNLLFAISRGEKTGDAVVLLAEMRAAAGQLREWAEGKILRPDKEPMRLSLLEINVLAALAIASPRPMLGVDIEAADGCSRRTVSEIMPRLVEAGLVARVGERQGWSITEAGKNLLHGD